MSRRRTKRRRNNKRKAIERLATIAPYVAELRRSKVPPGVVRQASKLIAILIGGRR
jgi:hypothetical protein